MLHLKRLLWLVAWGVWLWLGVGLYRELPRQLGPKIGEIPLVGRDGLLGFVGDTNQVAVAVQPSLNEFAVKVYDAATGAFAHDVTFRGRGAFVPAPDNCGRHGVVITRGEGLKNAGLYLVDLRKLEWKTLSTRMAMDVCVHPSRTWVAFRESAPPVERPRTLVVVDWVAGREVFLRPQQPHYESIGKPFFFGVSDRLAVPILRPSPEGIGHDGVDLEIWTIGEQSRLEKTVRLPKLGNLLEASRSGRVAWTNINDENWNVEVFDLDEERRVLCTPAVQRQRIQPGNYLMAIRTDLLRLSKDGRRLWTSAPPEMWDVDLAVAVLSFSEHHRPVLLSDDTFVVTEYWDQPWTGGRLFSWATGAVRDFESGRMLWRCFEADASVLQCRSADGTLGVSSQGAVHRLPFAVNWPLLAFCQSILALPLLLLWAILRWRRTRRAARREPSETVP